MITAQVEHSQENPQVNSKGILLLLRTYPKLLSTKVVMGILIDLSSLGETTKEICSLGGLQKLSLNIKLGKINTFEQL